MPPAPSSGGLHSAVRAGGCATPTGFTTRAGAEAVHALTFDPGRSMGADQERFSRTIKYEEVYLHAYTNVREARVGIARCIQFFNAGRPHSSVDGRTPYEAYFNCPASALLRQTG